MARGITAFQFTLLDSFKKERSLQEYLGQWVILYFYPKDNTPGCTIEANEFTGLAKRFKNHKATILGVSPDSCASHQRFMERQALSITLLSDPDHEVAKRYGVWGLKKFLGKEYYGITRSTFLINPEGVIVHEWRVVKPTGHAEMVFKKLVALQD